MNYKPLCSTEIVFCSKKELVDMLLAIGAKNLVLVMSETSAARWNLKTLAPSLRKKTEKANGRFCWVKSVNPNPTLYNIIRALDAIGNQPVDAIIAIGGGSVIDLAKGVKAFYKGGNHINRVDVMRDAISSGEYCRNLIDLIAVPSTAGTGSEVTQWATIWDIDKKVKLSIDSPHLQPTRAIFVPELTATLSATMTLSTGLDAVTQAIEAYWSRHTNPIVQELSYSSIQLFIKYLRKGVDAPEDLEVRERLCTASLLAGLAFSQTRTTACHSISYPLTLHYGIAHGIAAAITLDPVSRINAGHFPNDARLFMLFSEYGSIGGWIDEICEGLIPMRLSQFGISRSNIPFIVERAFTEGRMDNNPVALTEKEVTGILLSVL